MFDWKEFMSFVTITFLCFACGFGFGILVKHEIDRVYGFSYDAYGTISNETDSMGLTIDPHDKMYYSKEFDVLPGRIYVYNKSDNWIVHRLVYCLDDDCNQSVFKGDNNYIGELVNKSNIIYKVEGISYG